MGLAINLMVDMATWTFNLKFGVSSDFRVTVKSQRYCRKHVYLCQTKCQVG